MVIGLQKQCHHGQKLLAAVLYGTTLYRKTVTTKLHCSGPGKSPPASKHRFAHKGKLAVTLNFFVLRLVGCGFDSGSGGKGVSTA